MATPSGTFYGNAATAAQAAPGAAGRASSTQLTQEQQLAYYLTPQQQQELFDRRQQAQGALREADIADQEAKAQHDMAVAQLQHARAKSAQGAVDEMIARGMLQSGTAAGALADIEVAAFQQKQALDTALTATQQRNLAVRSQAVDALRQLGTYATGLAGENLATGVRQQPGGGSISAPRPPGGLPGQSVAGQPTAPAASPKPPAQQATRTTWGQPMRITPNLGKPKKASAGNIATKTGRVGSNLPGY